MRLENVVVAVRDTARQLIAELPQGESTVEVSLETNAAGSWTVTTPTDSDAAEALRLPGSGIVVFHNESEVFSGPTVEPSVQYGNEDWAGSVTFTGMGDTGTLADRLVYPDGTNRIDTQTKDSVSYNDSPDSIMANLVLTNMGDEAEQERRIFGLEVRVVSDDMLPEKHKFRFDRLDEALKGVANPAGLVYQIVQRGDGLAFEVWNKSDRTDEVILSIEDGTLASSNITYKAPEVTTVIVGGEGAKKKRLFKEYTTDDSNAARDEWGRRIERYVDMAGTKDAAEMKASAMETLSEGGASTLSGQIIPVEDFGIEFGLDWFLGDFVLVIFEGRPLVAEVSGSVIKIDEQGVRLGVVLGDPYGFDPAAKAAQAIREQRKDYNRTSLNQEVPHDEIEQAAQAAALAQTLAEGAGKILIQNYEPSHEYRNDATLWVDTTDGKDTPKYWDGDKDRWVKLNDAELASITAAITEAEAKANAAQQAASNAADDADQAKQDAADAVADAGEAKTKADDARQAADDAQQAADDAQQAADDAQEDADAAQQTADSARSTANEAKQDASDAASDAAQAATDAAAAQSTANTAASDAATAQSAADQAAQDAAAVQGLADQAAADAATAQQAATDASQDALNAVGIAEDKGKVIYSSSEPTGGDAKEGNLWIKSPNHTPYIWDDEEGEWVKVTDQEALDAAEDAATARSDASQAASDAATAQQDASQAASDAATAQQDASQAAADAAAAQSTADDARSAADDAKDAADKAKDDAHAASQEAQLAKSIAEGKGEVVVSDTAPSSEYENSRTLWIDTSLEDGEPKNAPKYWDMYNDEWRVIHDKAIRDSLDAAAAAEAAAKQYAKSYADAIKAQLQADIDQNTADVANVLDQVDGRFPIEEVDISDDAITTPKLAAGSVLAETLGVGAVTTDKLAVNSVTFNKMRGDAIDGMTVTGATLRTAATGKRVEITSEDGLVGYDLLDNKVTQIGTDGMFESIGGVIKTADDGPRLEFDSSGLTGIGKPWRSKEVLASGFTVAQIEPDKLGEEGGFWGVDLSDRDVNGTMWPDLFLYSADVASGLQYASFDFSNDPILSLASTQEGYTAWLLHASGKLRKVKRNVLQDGISLNTVKSFQEEGDAYAIRYDSDGRIRAYEWDDNGKWKYRVYYESGTQSSQISISGTHEDAIVELGSDDSMYLASRASWSSYPPTGGHKISRYGKSSSSPNATIALPKNTYEIGGIFEDGNNEWYAVAFISDEQPEIFALDWDNEEASLLATMDGWGLPDRARRSGDTFLTSRGVVSAGFVERVSMRNFTTTRVDTENAVISSTAVNSTSSMETPVLYTGLITPPSLSEEVRITDVSLPVSDGDVANKEYVDSGKGSFAARLTGSFTAKNGSYKAPTKITNFTADQWSELPLTNRFVTYSNGNFTVEQEATFFINFVTRWGGSSKGRRYQMICVNGTQAYMWTAGPPDGQAYNTEIFRPVHMKVGDVLSFEVGQTSGSNLSIAGGTNSWETSIQIGVA